MFCIHRIKDTPPFSFIKFSSPKKKFLNQKRLVYILIFFLFAIFFLSISFNIYQWIFAKRVYWGVSLGPYSLGGKTKEEAEAFLHEKVDKFLSDFSFKALDEETTIPAIVSGVGSSDIVYSLIDYNFDEMADAVFKYGRSGNVLLNIKDIVKALVFGQKFSPKFTTRDELVISMLREKFSHLETEPQDAGVEISFNEEKTSVRLVPERNGKILDYETALSQLKKNLSLFEGREITVVPKGVSPNIKLGEISILAPSIPKIFDDKVFKIIFEDFSWNLPKTVLADWITFKKDSGTLRLGLDEAKIKDYLESKKIVQQIEIESKNAKFVFSADLSAEASTKAEGGSSGGKVIEFQASTTGRKVNYDWTIKSFEKFFFAAGETVSGEIKVDLIEPQVVTGSANTLGIEEMIGEGKTNFIGSPPNRIYNIKNGAKIISGLLIQPGETFSLNNALGEVGEATGFRPELVIKGDKTTPEFGGGLCQIATTLFRAALNSGLLIVSRTNHSYRVSYYEPPVGMDATVYSPSPDLKFINDTEAPILIQSQIEGNNLTFEFWGKKDGRTVEMSTPVIFNITEPEPTKIIETTDLKPGVKKCTEKAHKGADAYFDYKVTYPNNEAKEKRFKSHYRAWQEVCLVGVVATSTFSGL
jgi:vancomycin resistance protein YoaR